MAKNDQTSAGEASIMKKLHFTTLVLGILLGSVGMFGWEKLSYTAYAERTTLATESVLAEVEEDLNSEFPAYLTETFIATSTSDVVSTSILVVPKIPNTTNIPIHVPVIVYHSIRPHIAGESKRE